MHQLLIVTCDMDRWHFKLLCLTFEKYFEPCEINVIVNEDDPRPWLDWFDRNVKRRVRAHAVNIYTSDHFFKPQVFRSISNGYNGWITQQIFKLVFSRVTDRPYLVLDSKNWLIKHATYEEMALKRERRLLDKRYILMIDEAISLFNLDWRIKHRPMVTPFEIEPDIADTMLSVFGGNDNFARWFASFEHPSEFVLYDLFAQSIGGNGERGLERLENCMNFWLRKPGTSDSLGLEDRSVCQDPLDMEMVRAAIGHPAIKMLSIHRDVIKDRETANDLESMILSLL